MATKNDKPDSAADQQSEETKIIEQQPKEAEAQDIPEIGALCTKHKISRAVFAGVCSANGWKSGKAVTEEEFLKAIEHFKGSSIDGKPDNQERKRGEKVNA